MDINQLRELEGKDADLYLDGELVDRVRVVSVDDRVVTIADNNGPRNIATIDFIGQDYELVP